MADTKYQILYRFVNPNTNKPIVNDMDNTYKETFKFYTDANPPDSDSTLEDVIASENAASNNKYDMLFVYGGTKKYKPEHVDEHQYPYAIKDYYIRVPMAPWCAGGVYPSLESALQKCRVLADMMGGVDNIKLIKLVPFDQKVRIA